MGQEISGGFVVPDLGALDHTATIKAQLDAMGLREGDLIGVKYGVIDVGEYIFHNDSWLEFSIKSKNRHGTKYLNCWRLEVIETVCHATSLPGGVDIYSYGGQI